MRPAPVVLAFCFAGLAFTGSKDQPTTKFAQGSLARDGSVERDGFRLFYRVLGDRGRVVIMLAGGPGGDPAYLKPVIDRLKTKYQCVLLEQRGTGRSKLSKYNTHTINFESYLQDLEALQGQLKESKLLLIGHSWCGMLALSY